MLSGNAVQIRAEIPAPMMKSRSRMPSSPVPTVVPMRTNGISRSTVMTATSRPPRRPRQRSNVAWTRSWRSLAIRSSNRTPPVRAMPCSTSVPASSAAAMTTIATANTGKDPMR